MNKIAAATMCVIVGLAVEGCERVDSATALRADDSLTRTVTVTEQSLTGEAKVSDDIQFAGDGWKSTLTSAPAAPGGPNGGQQSLTGTRDRQPGFDGDDFVLKSKGADQVKCHLTTTKRPDGTIEYLETYTWVGAKPEKSPMEDFRKEEADVHKIIASDLAPLTPTEQQVTEFEAQFQRESVYAIFGPSHPMFAEFIEEPEMAVRHLRSRLFLSTTARLKSTFPSADQMTVEACARKIVSEAFDEAQAKKMNQASTPDQSKSPSDSPDFPLLSSIVQMPGKVIETNGEIDPLDGKVSWSMYALVTADKPVTFRAVSQP